MLRLSLILVVAVVFAAAGCGTKQPDPTTLPTYKDMTDPKNMPGMGAKPGAPATAPTKAP